MHTKLTLSVLILSLPVATAWAQRPAQGVVVTATGDTIRGELFQSERDARNQTVHIKPAGQPVATYTAATIRSFGRVGRPFVESKTYGPDRAPILVETLVQGPVGLYKGYQAAKTDVRYSPDIRYYLQQPDSSQLTLIEPATLALSLHRMLGDCPTIDFNQRITAQPKSYNTKRLTEVVQDYSTCKFSKRPEQASSPYRGWSTSWGIKAGMGQGGLHTGAFFRNLPNAESESTTNLQGGVFANLAYWNGFSAQVEVLLVQFKGSFTQPVYSGTNAYSIRRTAEFKFSQARLPLSVRYQLGHGLVRPFLLAGAHVGVEVSHTASIVDKRSDQTTSTDRTIIWPNALAFGLQGGGGVYLALPHLPGISLETIYSQGQQGTASQDNIQYRGVAASAAIHF